MSGPVTSVARVEDVQIFLKDPVHIFLCVLERKDAVTNEVLQPITFVLAYPNVCAFSVVLNIAEKLLMCSRLH